MSSDYDFSGKKLVFLDGSGLACNAVKRAQELGIWTIVANYYDAERSPAKAIADESWDVNFSDVDLMVEMIRRNHVDGILLDGRIPIYSITLKYVKKQGSHAAALLCNSAFCQTTKTSSRKNATNSAFQQ